MIKKWVYLLTILASTVLLSACKQDDVQQDTIPLTLNEPFYDSNSVSSGHLTGLVKSITFEEDFKGYIIHYQRSLAETGFTTTHYRVNFVYTIIDEDTLFITMGHNDVVFFDDHNNALSVNTLKTEVLMVSSDLILSNSGTHYLRESYLLENNYIASTDYGNVYLRSYQIYRGSVTDEEQYVLDSVTKVNSYKSNYPEANAYLWVPVNFFDNGGKHLVLHIETEANKKLEMRYFTYLNGELNVILHEVDDLSLGDHTTYLFLMIHFFDSFNSVTYTIQS